MPNTQAIIVKDPLKIYNSTFSEVVSTSPDLDPMCSQFIGIQVKLMLSHGCTEEDLKFAFRERLEDPDITDNIIEDAVAQLESSDSQVKSDTENGPLASTPFFATELYAQLPKLLQDCVSAFPDRRQKDLFLLSGLGAIGSVISKCEGYFTEELHSTLFSFILAPPASGKSALNYVEKLIRKVHNHKKVDSEHAVNSFKEKEKSESLTFEELANRPKKQYHIIPGNTSGAKIIQHLHDNHGQGLIIETEADTLAKSMANDWGNFSDVLRQAYHHETVRMTRRHEDEFLEVESPAFSVCLSGTPEQVKNLFGTTENGLVSRFLFYGFQSTPAWRDMSPKANPVRLKPHFEELSERVLELHLKWNHQDVQVSWTDEQWKLYNDTFEDMYNEVIELYGRDTHDLICRLGNACLRISMILTILVAFEKGGNRKALICDQTQLELAISMCKTLKEHTLLVFNNLPKRPTLKVSAKNRFEEAMDLLPSEFKRSEAIKAAIQVGMSERTMGNRLRRELGRSLTQPMTGYYKKVQ